MEHGIKIFVSHRIDIMSELVNNPLYVPVRCGAVFDDKNPMGIAGDDTGDNISEKRMSFCEFTVQYWAWKNEKADYYGLCHYRRYLSFTEKRYATDQNGMIWAPNLQQSQQKKYGLLDAKKMQAEIEKYDAVINECADVGRIRTPAGTRRTVGEMWGAHSGLFFKEGTIDLLIELIDRISPEYSESAREYFNGRFHRGFNCFILRGELFDRLCQFQFPILFEMENDIDACSSAAEMQRAPAYIGEILYGIFMYHITKKERWRVKELQLVRFFRTEKIQSRIGEYSCCMWFWLDRFLRMIAEPILPKGSWSREAAKRIEFAITHLDKLR